LRMGKMRLFNGWGLGSEAKKMAWLAEVGSRGLDLGQGMRFERTWERREGVRRVERLEFDGGGWEDILRLQIKLSCDFGGNV